MTDSKSSSSLLQCSRALICGVCGLLILPRRTHSTTWRGPSTAGLKTGWGLTTHRARVRGSWVEFKDALVEQEGHGFPRHPMKFASGCFTPLINRSEQDRGCGHFAILSVMTSIKYLSGEKILNQKSSCQFFRYFETMYDSYYIRVRTNQNPDVYRNCT